MTTIPIPRDLYDELCEYLSCRADVNDGEHGPQPNQALQLLSALREVA